MENNFFNYITKQVEKEDVDIWMKMNNIYPEKMELYYDFCNSLYLKVTSTYLGFEGKDETKDNGGNHRTQNATQPTYDHNDEGSQNNCMSHVGINGKHRRHQGTSQADKKSTDEHRQCRHPVNIYPLQGGCFRVLRRSS